MNKIDLVYGFLIGIAASLIGAYLFIEMATEYNFGDGLNILSANGQLGQLITLGAILNIAAFFLLLHFKKDLMARGVIFATIILTIITLIV